MVLSQKKTIIILIAAGLAFLTFWQIINTNLYRPRATTPFVNIALTPDSTSLAINETKSIKVVIKPANTANKISGFDIVFKAGGPLSIQGIGNPSVLGTGDTSIFTLVKKTTRRAFYTINLPDAKLPGGVLLMVTVKGVSPGGQAIFTTDQTLTKIIGNISGDVYSFGEVEKITLSVSTSTITTTPSVSTTPSQTPTPAQCSVAPAVPTNLSPTGTTGAGSQNLTWNFVSGATSYKVKIDDLSNGWSGQCGSLNAGDACLSPLANSASFNFVGGKTYEWWVQSINKCGTSNNSAKAKLTVLTATITLMPPVPTSSPAPTGPTKTPTKTPTKSPVPTSSPAPTGPTKTPTKTPTKSPVPTSAPTHILTPTLPICPTKQPCDGKIIVDDLLSAASTCAIYVCLTATPAISPTAPPTQCPLKPQGDANCDGKIDLTDFEIWRKEFRGELTSKDADFNSPPDGKVDLSDFEIWRRTFTGQK